MQAIKYNANRQTKKTMYEKWTTEKAASTAKIEVRN